MLVELLLALILVWLAYARWGGAPPPPGEDVVQVEYIGQGTPVEQGGGAPTGPAPQPRAAAPAASASAASSSPTRPTPNPSRAASASTPAPAVAAASVPQPPTPPEPAPPVAAQPLEVTQVPVPDTDFALQVPQLETQVEALQAVELPQPVAQRQVDVPVAQVRVPQVQVQPRALPTPAPPLPDAVARDAPRQQLQVQVPGLAAQVQALPAPAAALPGVSERAVPSTSSQVAVPGLRTGVAALPMPAGAGQATGAGADTGSSNATATAQGSGQTAGANAGEAGGPPSTAGGVQGAVAGAGAGPKPGNAPGAWSTPLHGDDWGDSDRNRAGGQAGASGVFDADGRVRLPAGSNAAADAAAAPYVTTEDITDLDHAGTWLKRPPIDYTPTTFDRFWIPRETLLQEWVRRGIKEVSIGIPGSKRKIHCVVSLLQLGGGCGIDNPDMQDQEATARPPPDVPWKPELQENQDVL
jgi:hypothetical protein